MQLSAADLKKLTKVHPDLQAVIMVAARDTPVRFMLMETDRSIEKQKENIKKGVSWTMRSRHIVSKDGLCRAGDVVPIDEKGKPIWAWPVYHILAKHIKAVAKKLGIDVEWGGDWKKTPDGPHWQLPWNKYP